MRYYLYRKISRALVPSPRVHYFRRLALHYIRFALFPGYPAREIRDHLDNYYPNLIFSAGDIVLDLGANDGWFSQVVAPTGANVIAFEPNPFSAARAIRRLRGFSNVALISSAVGDQTGITTLMFPSEYRKARVLHSGSASIESSNRAVANETSLAVFVVSLGEILANLERVRFLKIDVEGSERLLWPILEENWQKIDNCAIETHERLIGLDGDWVSSAQKFIDSHGLSQRWRLDWP